ncbi:MAG: energy transducer TonB [Gammaproteobacteria bacterium]
MSGFRDVRFILALIGGAIIALALFIFLHWLISGNYSVPGGAQQVNLVSFVHVQRQPQVQTKQRVAPPPPKQPKHPPPPEQVQTQTQSNVQTQHLPVNIQFDANSLSGGTGVYINPNARGPTTSAGGYAPLTPQVRFRPAYPPRAAVEGVTGSIKTCFTVEPDGSVHDPHVVHSSTPQARRLFSQSALQAIRQWKFFPKKENGKPIAARACQTLTFNLNG